MFIHIFISAPIPLYHKVWKKRISLRCPLQNKQHHNVFCSICYGLFVLPNRVARHLLQVTKRKKMYELACKYIHNKIKLIKTYCFINFCEETKDRKDVVVGLTKADAQFNCWSKSCGSYHGSWTLVCRLL